MIKATIFDLDGTLVYHERKYILSTVKRTLLELGLQADEEFAYKFWYGSDRDKIIKDTFGIEPMDFWNVFWKYDNPQERVKYTKVYKDVNALKKLKKRVKLGIVTGAVTEVANAEISKIKSKIKCDFDIIISNNPNAGIRQKPYPDTLLICLKELD